MRPRSYLATSSSNADRPHRPGSASDLVASSASSASTSAPLSPASQEYGNTPPMSPLTVEDEEAEEGVDTVGQHGGQGENDDDVDDGDDGDDGDDDCKYYHNHPHPHSHQQQQQYGHPQPHHPFHVLPPSTHVPFYDTLDEYVSDDLDMQDDAGPPPVNYLEVAQLLTSDMDVDPSVGSSGEFEFDSPTPDIGQGSQQVGGANLLLSSETQPFPPPPLGLMLSQLPAPIHPPPLNPSAVSTQLEQLVAGANNPVLSALSTFSAWFEGTHPVALTNPNPGTLGPGNYGLSDFLHCWARQSRSLSGLPRERSRYPWPSRINDLTSKTLNHVQYADLAGDLCDLQGIDWEELGVSRKEARERRLLTYNNYVNHHGSDRWTPNLPDQALRRTDSFFRFRRMDIRRDVTLSHFQLRNVLACTSRTSAFYPGNDAVHQFNPVSGGSRVAMSLGVTPGSQVSTLAAGHGILLAGRFNGEYLMRRLDSEEPEAAECHDGLITTNLSGITNHIQIHEGRGATTPLAAFASNDTVFRVLDVATETWLSREKFPFPLNCSALSPDHRLRVMVGDDLNVLVTAAESTLSRGRPEVLQSLAGHRDYGFACDWADDGWTVATGFQDKSIKIWDARWWSDSSGTATPVCTLRTEMSGVRSLRFSPIGSGKRVLVAAEEADFVNIIDAQTFMSKQTVDIFGEIGGVTFMNDGHDLGILCCDRLRGGLIQLERCGAWKETTGWGMDDGLATHNDYRWRRGGSFDWQRSRFTEHKRVKETMTRRRRRPAMMDDLEPF